MKLNLGCGSDIKKGYVNLDSVKLSGVDVVHDLDKIPYPFKANTFGEVYARHVLEHVTDLVATLEELLRITKPGGKIVVICPYFSNPGAFSDPTHKRFFTYNTFDYFTVGSGLSYYSKVRVCIISRRIRLFGSLRLLRVLGFVPELLINLVPVLYQRFFAYVLPAAEIEFVLKK